MSVTTVSSSDCSNRRFCSEKHFCTEGRFALANQITGQILERAAGDFGKLVLLASLSSPHSFRYRHPAFDETVPACLASLVLQCNHEQVFSKWLELALEEQWKAVNEYLAAKRTGAADVSLEKLVPGGARGPERELFLTDLELVLSLLET
jgi:hypothetical protein